LNEFRELLGQVETKKVPGLSNAAKQVKDQLANDPYNMDLIWQLGKAYGEDEQWEKVATVLMRGFKRVPEFKDSDTRFEYLKLLSEASLQQKKYRQALAVLNDVEEPGETDIGFEVLRCQVYCFNNEVHKGLRAFNKAIEGQDFELVGKVWSACIPAIKQAGAYDATKRTVEDKATNDDERQKILAMSRLMELRDELQQKSNPIEAISKGKKTPIVYYAVTAIAVLVLGVLWHLESQSLAKHGIK